ncbi:flagellin N-terminal helical domain-containing protein [Pectobacterium brasiliense]|uniref:Flagellin n=1 Tax=Pectobacterium brasiliense TaxID=180957 RepID=A0A0M2F4D6_9GAMM|nr:MULTISPECIES: flagellin [Pectobacterium]KGA35185.1 flagellin [Pectobacterium brasiliense]KMK81629.1 flagellin domain-containing protein [Pectobacterium brasiliense ICMP 19477]MBN3082788.1 flagellin FliC [Pectobacterium polaris]MBN3189595.1 flagellin FliC [Pectobacterium brasiliense]OYN51448.1 flagellin FliC [Pectobacterium carotovorum]
MAGINTNVMSLLTQNNLSKSQSSLGTAIERLSSGLRINSAKDDAAGQAIANGMTAQIKGLTQASRNANDGISLVQTAETNLNEINNNLQRIRELSVQAASDTNTTENRESIALEISQRVSEIDRITNTAKFNGIDLLKGDANLSIQVGANTETDDAITIGSSALIGSSSGDLGVTGLDVSTAAAATASISAIDAALKQVDTARSNLGAIQNRFESTITNLNNTVNNLSAARGRIEDADYATEVSNMSKANILQQAGTSVLSQANQVPQNVLSLLR